MKDFEFTWEARVQRSVVIQAETEEEAYNKWLKGEYGPTETNDEDMLDDYVDLNGEAYYNNRFERAY